MSHECLASWLMLLWLYLAYLVHRWCRSRTRKNEHNERSSVLVRLKGFHIASQGEERFKARLPCTGKIAVALPVKLIFTWLFQCVCLECESASPPCQHPAVAVCCHVQDSSQIGFWHLVMLDGRAFFPWLPHTKMAVQRGPQPTFQSERQKTTACSSIMFGNYLDFLFLKA